MSKIEHALGLTGLRSYFGHHLYSGYESAQMETGPCRYLSRRSTHAGTIDRMLAGGRFRFRGNAGIAAGIPVFYYCADPHNPPIDHPLVTPFHDMGDLPQLWREKGWKITA